MLRTLSIPDLTLVNPIGLKPFEKYLRAILNRTPLQLNILLGGSSVLLPSSPEGCTDFAQQFASDWLNAVSIRIRIINHRGVTGEKNTPTTLSFIAHGLFIHGFPGPVVENIQFRLNGEAIFFSLEFQTIKGFCLWWLLCLVISFSCCCLFHCFWCWYRYPNQEKFLLLGKVAFVVISGL